MFLFCLHLPYFLPLPSITFLSSLLSRVSCLCFLNAGIAGVCSCVLLKIVFWELILWMQRGLVMHKLLGSIPSIKIIFHSKTDLINIRHSLLSLITCKFCFSLFLKSFHRIHTSFPRMKSSLQKSQRICLTL